MEARPPRQVAESFRLLNPSSAPAQVARCFSFSVSVGHATEGKFWFTCRGKRACFSRPRWKETRGILCRSKLFVIQAEEL